MRKVVVAEFVTLDGVMEAPNEWSFPYWNDEIANFKYDELFASDALLLGRVTYEGFAAAWPSRNDEDDFTARMNNIPKYVASTTLHEVAWNNSHLLQADVAGHISTLKEQPSQNILLHGSATLVQTLIQHNLVDEYRLLVYPIVLGRGLRLFLDGSHATLKLVESESFDSGVVAMIYHPAQET